MIYIEITLNNVVCAKRCPKFVDDHGMVNTQAIRNYFCSLGYEVGHIRLC